MPRRRRDVMTQEGGGALELEEVFFGLVRRDGGKLEAQSVDVERIDIILRPVCGSCRSSMDGAGVVLRVVESQVDGVSDVVLVGEVLGDAGVKAGQERGESFL